MTKSRGILAPRHKWTAQEIATLRRRYPDERTADIARDLGIAVHLVYARANNACDDGTQLACSRACIEKVAAATGKTSVVLPI